MADVHDEVAHAGNALEQYELEPRLSRFTIRAFAGGLLSAFAHNPTFVVRQFVGHVVFDPSNPSKSSVSVSLQAASLDLIDSVSESDRREIERILRENVLEIERFPAITFESRHIEVKEGKHGGYHATATGSMSLHGVTRECVIDADAFLMGTQLRVNGTWPLKQTDFGIALVSVAAQAIKVKDELQCSFDLVARRQG
ncbi:MAG TPA: YceI family protein [Vicinamibacterales bacterium]|nr:YceI family protein [Vicinamibacterales bacterium]